MANILISFLNLIYLACDIHEATCRNGQCIPRSGLCDGKPDCTDRSDEIYCDGKYLILIWLKKYDGWECLTNRFNKNY